MPYYINSDEAMCDNCFPIVYGSIENFLRVVGSQEGEWPIYLSGDEEVDCPNHCVRCEDVVEDNLTTEGVNFVIEALADYVVREEGRPYILDQWAAILDLWGVDDTIHRAVMYAYEQMDKDYSTDKLGRFEEWDDDPAEYEEDE